MKNKLQDKTFLLRTGEKYELRVLKLLLIQDNSYYICVDQNGLKHLVPEVYYIDYGIKPGNVINCRLDRINCLGRFYFEPEHPVYSRDCIYDFKLKAINPPSGNNSHYSAIVEDVFGKEWETLEFEMRSPLPVEPASLLCRVRSLKKARLFLEIVDPALL
jgi:hypothetical protein